MSIIRPKTTPVAFAAVFLTAAFFRIAAASAEGLTPAEEKKLQYCEAGIAELNPEIAAECLNEKFLLDKLTALDSNKSAGLIQKGSTLKDLLDILDMHTGDIEMRNALSIRLADGMPAAALGIGPRPEKFLEWADKYRPRKSELVKKAIRSWGSIDNDEKQWLQRSGYTPEKWTQLALAERSRLRYRYAKSLAWDLLNTPQNIDRKTTEELDAKAGVLWKELDTQTNDRLTEHVSQLKARLEAGEKGLALLKSDKNELHRFQAELETMKEMPVSQQLLKLNELFENSPSLKASKPAASLNPGRAYPQTGFSPGDRPIIAGLLQKALFEEIKGTMAGDRVIGFFNTKGNILSLKTAPIPGFFGMFYPQTGDLNFSEPMIQQWLEAHDYTPRDLQTKPEALKKLAAFLSPVFVHESTHQQQLAWLKSRQFPPEFGHDSEIEAISVASIYIIEKSSKDPSFARMLSSDKSFPFYTENLLQSAKDLQTDPREFKRKIQSTQYSTLPSFEATASRFLSATAMIADELQRRKNLPVAEQQKLEAAGLTANSGMPLNAVIRKIKTSLLEEWKKKGLEWYSETLKQKEVCSEWVNDSLSELKNGKSPRRNAKLAVPSPAVN